MTQTTQRAAVAVPKDPAQWSEFLRELQEKCFVVGPISDFRELPEGFEVRPTYVMLEPGADSFKVGSDGYGDNAIEQHALTKSGIEKLALAAGAVAKATRIDDRKDPLRCEFEATAMMKLLDGSPHAQMASRAYDLRPEGQDYVEVYDKAYDKAMRYPPKGLQGDVAIEKNADTAARRAVAAARAAMTRNCESKAKLRAMRSLLGLRSKYPLPDLRTKAFAVLKLHFTARSKDPETQRMMTRALVHSYLGATSALFGMGPSASRELPAPASDESYGALPAPEGMEPDVDPHERIDANTGEVAQEPAPAAPPATAPPTAPVAPQDAPQYGPHSLVPEGLPGAGKSIVKLDAQELSQLSDAISQQVDAAKKKGASPAKLARAEAFLNALCDEVERRRKPAEAAEKELPF